MVLFSVRQIGECFGVVIEDERMITQADVDGRLCRPGGIYFALKGEKSDGHQFLSQAAERGAIAAVVQKEYKGDGCGLALIRVEDPLEALQQLAHYVVEIRQPFVIGITGSIGKTTVKEFIAVLLAIKYKVSKSPSSYNGQIGLPIAILNSDPDAEVLVLEMGMSYKNEMRRLVEIVPPHFAVITRVAPAHIGHFSSLEEIAQEKAKILSSAKLQCSFIHSMNHHYLCMKHMASQMLYSGVQSDGFFEQDELVDKRRGESQVFDLPFSEKPLVENFLVAALVAREMGISYKEMCDVGRSLKPFHHRFEKIHLEYPYGVVVIDDSYNNNPISLKTALQNIPKPKKGGKVIAVIGEMRELGKLSKMAHEEIGIIALPIVDMLLCYGVETAPLYDLFTRHHKQAYYSLEKNIITNLLQEHLHEGDVVLIKGANSNRLWELVDTLKERDCVKQS